MPMLMPPMGGFDGLPATVSGYWAQPMSCWVFLSEA